MDSVGGMWLVIGVEGFGNELYAALDEEEGGKVVPAEDFRIPNVRPGIDGGTMAGGTAGPCALGVIWIWRGGIGLNSCSYGGKDANLSVLISAGCKCRGSVEIKATADES
jgi:hypothetical protein